MTAAVALAAAAAAAAMCTLTVRGNLAQPGWCLRCHQLKHINQTAAGHGLGCALADSGCALVTWAAPLWLELCPCSLWLAAPSWLGLPLLLQQKICRGGSGSSGNLGQRMAAATWGQCAAAAAAAAAEQQWQWQ